MFIICPLGIDIPPLLVVKIAAPTLCFHEFSTSFQKLKAGDTSLYVRILNDPSLFLKP